MKFLKDTAMDIMIKISFQVFTFSIQTKKVASAVAGSSRKVSNNTTNSKSTLWFYIYIAQEGGGIEHGSWDAVHLVTTNMDHTTKKCKYRLNSTIYLTLDQNNEQYGKVAIAGHVAKVKEEFVVQ